MNASWWIDEDKTVEAEKYCEKIIDGEYGFYDIDNRWDAPFDWDNDKSNELLFGYPSSFGGMHWLYDYEMFWQVAPFHLPFHKVGRHTKTFLRVCYFLNFYTFSDAHHQDIS